MDTPGQELVERLAQEMAGVAGEMLTDPGYRFQPQHIQVPFSGQIGNWRGDPAKALGYVKVRPGLYRPKTMPPLPLEATEAAAGGSSNKPLLTN
jgi:hypothetical protein